MLKFKLDEELIKRLSDLLKDNNLSEIELKDGVKSIKVSRVLGSSTDIQYLKSPEKIDSGIKNDDLPQNNYTYHEGAIRAPMVGTLYHSSSPDAKPYILEGSEVNIGDTLFIIEAMKTMNQVKSDKKGIIKKILVKNREPVEFDDIIAIIE